MTLLEKLPEIIRESKSEFDDAAPGNYSSIERNGWAGNILAKTDNISFIKYLLSIGMGGKIRMIYADPPFFSDTAYDATVKSSDGAKVRPLAYEDKWGRNEEKYVRTICRCLWGMKELLSEEGTIWVHLDWHVVHYIKIAMDEIFGRNNFINEIIWQYKSGGSSRKHFARKHDTLLFYGKSDKYYLDIPKEKSYNRDFKPYRFKNVQEYEDEKGWYTLVNMKDVWSFDMVGRTSSERTGYATQKPEKLISLIVKSCSREGDICADFFCGSGTFPVVCGKLRRRFMTCDQEALAIGMTKKRLLSENIAFEYYIPADQENSDGRLKVDFVESGGYCDLRITGYEPDANLIRLNKKDAAVLAASLEQDPLCLIDSWSLDTSYDGKIHKNHLSFVRSNESSWYHYNGKFSGSISLIVRDIFGGEVQWVYNDLKD